MSQLLEHHDEVLKTLEEGGNVDGIYADFAEAYGKVDHAKLKMKNKLGIQGRLGLWIQNFVAESKKSLWKKQLHKNLK